MGCIKAINTDSVWFPLYIFEFFFQDQPFLKTILVFWL